MNIETIVIIAIPAAIVLLLLRYVSRAYNRLVNLRMDVDRQASHIQAHLKKKFDLIPALAECVKGYASHEKGTFEDVTRLRSQWGAAKSNDEKVRAANQLESVLSKLLVIQERYPKLKADRSFQSIMKSTYYVEKELLHERKVYNKRVSSYNVKLQEFPTSIIAKLFGFKEKPFYQKDETTLNQ